jgi:hypothetical protein
MYSFADAVTPAVEAEEYEFKDGAYDFTVTAYSNQGSEVSETYRVYIDTTPPEITISQVEGAYSADRVNNIDEYTVNGVVRVAIANPMEENGLNRVDGPTGPREMRYYISGNPADLAKPPEELYALGGISTLTRPRSPRPPSPVPLSRRFIRERITVSLWIPPYCRTTLPNGYTLSPRIRRATTVPPW